MTDRYNRDPGASPDDAGIPEVADDMTPGSGDVPEPELPTVPTDQPASPVHMASPRPSSEKAHRLTNG